jgi:hypothetical protein
MLLPKTMVTEIRETAEKRRQEECAAAKPVPLASRYDSSPLAAPDAVFDFSDRWGRGNGGWGGNGVCVFVCKVGVQT